MLFSFVLTLVSAVVLVLHLPTVSTMADIARRAEGPALYGLGGDLVHPGIGLGVLLVVQVLYVYQPRGMTQYGRRKQKQRQVAPL